MRNLSTSLTIFFFALALSINAQDGIEIKIDGQSDDISGQTHTMVAPGPDIFDVLFVSVIATHLLDD